MYCIEIIIFLRCELLNCYTDELIFICFFFLAEELFKKAQHLLNATRTNKVEAYKLLAAAATLGHREARSMLAWAQLLGTQTSLHSSTQNIPAALQTFKELADTGLPSANMGMGFLYAMGLGGVNASQAKALLHYTVAALGGDTRAEMALGYRYYFGVSTTATCERALDFYRRVANKVAEQVSLSGGPVVQRVRLLDEQENPEYNTGILDEDLIEYYQLLAQRGDVQAQVGLGQLHYQGGRGVPLDHQKALDYFQHAADAGNPVAMAFLGKVIRYSKPSLGHKHTDKKIPLKLSTTGQFQDVLL